MLTALAADESRAELRARVDALLDQLEADPTVAELRTRRFANGLWAKAVVGGGERWLVLWDYGQAADVLDDARPRGVRPGELVVLVHYVGPASFA